MNYLLIYLKFIDQIIENHDKRRDQMQKVLKSFVPKVVPQPWMPPTLWGLMVQKVVLEEAWGTPEQSSG
jgi:hypothetical protein